MKKPKLKEVPVWTLENHADYITTFYDEGYSCEYREASQRLVDLFVPDGWRLDLKDIDLDVFVNKMEAISEVLGSAQTILSYRVSCNARELIHRLTNPLVKEFTRWLKGEFDKYGKELEK